MIKKYQDMIGNILATFVDVVDEDKTYGFYHNSEHYYNTDYYTQNKHYFDELEKLAIEKDEQESRKDKLIVGSQWECVAENRGRNAVFKKGIEAYIWEVKENFVNFGYGTVYGYVRDSIPIEQFLLCFKPLKEGE